MDATDGKHCCPCPDEKLANVIKNCALEREKTALKVRETRGKQRETLSDRGERETMEKESCLWHVGQVCDVMVM